MAEILNNKGTETISSLKEEEKSGMLNKEYSKDNWLVRISRNLIAHEFLHFRSGQRQKRANMFASPLDAPEYISSSVIINLSTFEKNYFLSTENCQVISKMYIQGMSISDICLQSHQSKQQVIMIIQKVCQA